MKLGPLVCVHDHLDGGVRPQTVLDLAASQGVPTPADDAAGLAEWMTLASDLSMPEAFSRFEMVGSVLQRADALERVAVEAVEDLAEDGTVYAELRFAPGQHTATDLEQVDAIDAVQRGLVSAMAATGIEVRLICCAMRDQPAEVSVEVVAAAAAAAAADGLVVGVDLAGIEPGFPAEIHAPAFDAAEAAGLGITIHAGEMDGPHQIASALEHGHPARIGHGWRIIDDCVVEEGRIVELRPTAAALRDSGVLLEICLTSNTLMGTTIAGHPAKMLRDAGFRICLNPDDRTITTTELSREHRHAHDQLGFSRFDLAQCNERAMVAAFCTESEREALVEAVRDGWAETPAQLVHLAERERWEAGESYLPAEYEADGFVHLSGVHQLLTPANRFYRGRRDLVALVVDPARLGPELVWESGTGTLEYFPHLYGALPCSSVIGEVPMQPGTDGSFLLPPQLLDL